METIEIKLEKIKPYGKNAKKHPAEQVKNIAESIKQFGWAQPIVIDENNEIIIGHGRLLAAKRLKLKTAPCYVMTGLNEAQKRKLRLLDNKLNESDWDIDLLSEEIADLDFSDFPDIDFGVLTDEEDKEIIEDEVPEVNEDNEPITKVGDIWQLGKHRLICGDSTDPETVSKLMNGETADLLLTDPPYNVDYEGATENKLTIKNDNLADADFVEFCSKLFKNGCNTLKNGGGVLYMARLAHSKAI